VSTGHKIVSNVFFYFLDFFTLTLSGYIFWVMMGKMLPPEQYGVLTAVLALFYVLMTIALTGFPESLPKLISEFTKKGHTAAAGGIIKYSFKVSMVIGLLFSAVIFFASGWISQSVYGNAEMVGPLQMVAFLLFTANLGNVSKAALQGMQNFKMMFVADVVGNIGKLALAAGLVMLGWAAIGGAAAWVLYYAITALICGLAAFMAKIPAGTFDKRMLWRFSALSTGSQLSYYLLQQAGVLILAMLTNATTVAYFGVAALFGQVLMFVPSVMTGSVFPTFSELWVTNKEAVRKLLSASLKLSVLSVLPFVALFIVASKPLVELIYSSAYLPAASLFPVYMLGAFLFGPVQLLLITMYAIGRPGTRLGVISLGTILNIGLCFLLIPMLGMMGAAVAFMTSQVIAFAAALFVTNQSIPLSFSRRNLWAFPAVLIFAAVLATHVLTPILWLKAVIAVVALLIYVMILFATHAIGRPELVLLDYFPDKFGFGTIKKAIRKIVEFF